MKISVQNCKSNDKHYKTDNTTGFTQTISNSKVTEQLHMSHGSYLMPYQMFFHAMLKKS